MPTTTAEPIPPQHSPHGEQDSAVHEPQVDTTSEQAPEEESAATAEALTGNPAEPVMEASPGGTPVAAAPAAMAPMSGAPAELAPMEGNPVSEEEPAMAEEQESATQEFASGEGSAPPSDGDAAAGAPADSGASGSGDSGATGDDPAAGTGEQAEPAEGEQEQSEEGEGSAGGAPAGPVHTTPRTPEEDPNFQATVARKDETVAEQEAHEAPAVAAGAAQAAAVSPANERESLAEAGQVNEMDQEEPGVFDAASFKAMLMEAIRAILPKNNDEADDFASSGKVDRIKDQATSQVESEKESAAGNIEERTQEAPDTGSVPERQVEPLTPQDPGPAPVDIAAGSAMPPARGNAEVNAPLDQNVAEMDQTMADAEVTDDQLANSNEPAFTGALASKNDAETHAQEAPVQFRQQEQETLAQSESNAQATGEAQLAAMHQDRSGVMAQVTAGQQNTATQDTAARQKVADHINTLYEQTKTDVESILSGLDSSVETMFSDASDRATQVFEDLVEKRMRAYKRRRYSGLIGKGRWVKDLFAGLPDEANRFFTEGRDLYLHIMDTELTTISEHVAKELTAAKDRIQKGKQDIQDYVVSLPKDLQQVGKDAADEINDKFDELTESVNSKGEELVDTIADMYKESLDAVDARIEEMKAANRGLIDMALGALMGVIKTILMIKDMLFNLLAAALEAIGAIISDPIGFLSNLIEGVKQGVQNFLSNILNHVMTGVIEWLTGSLGDVGIQMPDNLFSLGGIFDLVTQILGLTWDYFRDKAVKMLGEPMVSAMETGFELFQIIQKDGIMGLWEHIKEQFNDLQAIVMDAIRDMIITKVIEAGIKWILGLLNPAGAFIKAAMLIIDIVKFFVERAAQIFELVNAFIDGIKALASGNVSAVAAAIEKALAKAIPVLIGFLASLVGVTGLTAKVQKIIKKIRKRIDKAITKVIRKAKRAFGKLVKKGKAKVKGAVNAVMNWWKNRKPFKLSDGSDHELFYKKKGENYEIYMASANKINLDEIKGLPKDQRTARFNAERKKALGKVRLATKITKAGGPKNTAEEKAMKDAEAALNQLSLVVALFSEEELMGAATPGLKPVERIKYFMDNSKWKPTKLDGPDDDDQPLFTKDPAGGDAEAMKYKASSISTFSFSDYFSFLASKFEKYKSYDNKKRKAFLETWSRPGQDLHIGRDTKIAYAANVSAQSYAFILDNHQPNIYFIGGGAVSQDLMDAVEGAGSLNEFLIKLVTSNVTVGTVIYNEGNLDSFESKFFSTSSPNASANKKWMAGQLRQPHKHEWLPTSELIENVRKAIALGKMEDASEGVNFIRFQDQIRSDTWRIVFYPSKSKQSKDGYDVLQGHSGALYIGSKPQTAGQPLFHDLLRNEFVAAKTAQGLKNAIWTKVANQWIWGGEDLTILTNIHPELTHKNHGKVKNDSDDYTKYKEFQKNNKSQIEKDLKKEIK